MNPVRTGWASLLTAILICLWPATLRAQIGIGGGGNSGDGTNTRLGKEDPYKKADEARTRAQFFLKKGMDLESKGKIRPALVAYKSAFDYGMTAGPDGHGVDEGTSQAAISRLKGIYDEGVKKLDDARKLYGDGKFVEAVALAERVRVLYAGVFSGIPGSSQLPNVATLAVKLIEDIESDPKAAPILQQEKAAPLTKKLARYDREAQKDPRKLLDVLQVIQVLVEKYPDCASGHRAAERLAEMQKDKSLMARLENEAELRKLRGDLALADQFIQNGRPEKAQEIYDGLKRRYPGKSIPDLKALAVRPDPLTVGSGRD